MRKIFRIICFVLSLSIMSGTFLFASYGEGIFPSVSARSAILMDADGLRVLYRKDADLRLPMASTTKIMTAIVAIEHGELDREFSIPAKVCGVEGSSVYLAAGEVLTLRELIYALMLSSANDAASAIAVCVSGSEADFVELMNEKAYELGLQNTHFENPHGLDGKEHYTTAYELGYITAYAMQNDTFCEIVGTKKQKIESADGTERYLVNHNKLLSSYEGCIGVKTGFTKKSGRCLVSAAERDGMRLVCVTLSDGDDWIDHKTMLDYGFRYYSSVTLCNEGQSLYELPVTGKDTVIPCIAKDTVRLVLPNGTNDRVKLSIECRRFLWETPKNGERVGRVLFFKDGKVIGESELIAKVDAENKEKDTRKKGFFEWLGQIFKGS